MFIILSASSLVLQSVTSVYVPSFSIDLGNPVYISIMSGPLSVVVFFELQKLQISHRGFDDRSPPTKLLPIGVKELVDEKVGETKTITSATLQLERSDEGRALLGPWIDSALERMRVAERGISKVKVGPVRGGAACGCPVINGQ